MSEYRTSRRRFIGTLGAAALAAPAVLTPKPAEAATRPSFAHGIASGDPLSDRVILWTRISDAGSMPRVYWEIARDAGFGQVLRSGLARTSASVDYTVKVDVAGLSPDTVYYYRFTCNGLRSPVGRTRTLPVGHAEQVRLAVFSCSNYPAGYFHAYAEAAKLADVNAAIHLGDFIYEYGQGGYATEDSVGMNRLVQPAHECISLSDYRARHALYRTDAGMQALAAAVPLIAVWDDHEVCNNTYVNGAANHSASTEGSYVARRAAALKAYHEWLPIRTPDTGDLRRIYRSFDFGDLLSLHMLETRLLARSEQLSFGDFVTPDGIDRDALMAAIDSDERAMMGSTQLDWLETRLAASSATWQVLGQQVLMARMQMPAPIVLRQISIGNYGLLMEKAATRPQELTRAEQYILAQPSIPHSTDAWDGYGADRDRLLGMARALDKNLVVLAGDTHNAWASNLVDADGNEVGVEFATPGVSSPGMEESRRTDDPETVAAWMVDNVADLAYAETAHRGFMVVSATHARCESTWYFVDTVKSKDYTPFQGATVETRPGADKRHLQITD